MNKELLNVGVDIGGTNTALGILDLDNNSLFEESFLTKADEGIISFIDNLSDRISRAYKNFDNKYQIQGIGVAAPGANYSSGTIESSANLKWELINFIDLMAPHFHVPITLINDANAAALGEKLSGTARGMKNFIVITLGTGLGTGIIIDDELLVGENGFAGEFGHVIIESEGRECNCGRSGCLETYVSANGLRRTVSEFLGKYNDQSELRALSYDQITAKLIADLAIKKDPIALKAFDFTGEILGKALANLVSCFDPKLIVLSGGFVQSEELLLVPTQRSFEKNLLNIYKDKVKIVKSNLPNGRAAILGSISYLKKVLNNSVVEN